MTPASSSSPSPGSATTALQVAEGEGLLPLLPRVENEEACPLSQRLFAPKALAWVTGTLGAFNFIDALIPREPEMIERMEEFIPLEISEGSRFLQVVAGVALLVLARGLWRQKHAAWVLAVAAFTLMPVLHLSRDFNWTYATTPLIMLAWLFVKRKAFVAKSDRPSIGRGLRLLPVLAGAAYVGSLVLIHQVRSELGGFKTPNAVPRAAAELLLFQKTRQVHPLTPRAAANLQVITFGGPVVALLGLILFLRPVVAREHPTVEDFARVKRLIDQNGDDILDQFALMEDKQFFFTADGRCVVVYARWRNFAVTLGDPIGVEAGKAGAVAEFSRFCRLNDWQPVFYTVSPRFLDAYLQQGFTSFKIAEEAVLVLKDFTLKGGRYQNVRTAQNRARKLGWQTVWYTPANGIDHGWEAQMKLISDAWLAAKHGGEMTFDIGAFSVEEIHLRGAALMISPEGRVEAFCTWLPYAQGRGRVIDLMRARHDAPLAMDALIVDCLQKFQADGLEEVSLANAPLANCEEDPKMLSKEEKAVKYFFENFNKLYGYKSLFFFKNKFVPQWRPRYLAYRGAASLPMIALALAGIHTPGGLGKIWKS